MRLGFPIMEREQIKVLLKKTYTSRLLQQCLNTMLILLMRVRVFGKLKAPLREESNKIYSVLHNYKPIIVRENHGESHFYFCKNEPMSSNTRSDD